LAFKPPDNAMSDKNQDIKGGGLPEASEALRNNRRQG